jgi:thiol-disulfide isomerase/thioredoxin
MRKYFLLLGLIVSLAIHAQEIKKVKIGDVINMIDTSTCPLVVNFWATWCGPCVHELPWIEKQVNAMKKENVRLLLVSLDFHEDYPKKIIEFAKKHGYDMSQIVWLDETDANMFCPKIDKSWGGTIPVTLMVNNKTHYRQFYEEQIPEQRLKLELKKLVQ